MMRAPARAMNSHIAVYAVRTAWAAPRTLPGGLCNHPVTIAHPFVTRGGGNSG
jgi:hypothetical protein